MLLQELERHADQVVEIHALVGGEPLFVAAHDARRDALVVVGGLGLGLRGVQPHVLPLADGPLPDARGRGVGGAAGVLEDLRHVVAVEDAEGWFQTQHGAVFAHHAHAQRMEGAYHHVLRIAPDQPLGTFAHLGRGLVGEGDGGDALGFQAGLDQARDLVRDDARLARTRAGKHEAGTVHVVDGFLLREVETGGHGEGQGRGRRKAGNDTGRRRTTEGVWRC
jgi:hypothetical protein